MPIFTQDAVGIGQDGFTASVSPVASVGAIGRTRDGRVFRYAKAGVADLVAGNVVQSPAIVTAHLGIVPVAAGFLASQIVATLGAVAAAAGQYAEGYVDIDTAPGNGLNYQIAGHAAVLSGGVITLNLRPEDALQVALGGASRVGLCANPYNGVIQCPAVLTGLPVGVAGYVIPAGQYGWIQTGGPASVLVNGTPGLGIAVVNGATAAGSVDVATAGNLVTNTLIGNMMQAGVTGKNNFVFLKL